MSNDQKTTISGLVAAIGAALVTFFPTMPWIGGLVSAIGLAVLGYYTNKA